MFKTQEINCNEDIFNGHVISVTVSSFYISPKNIKYDLIHPTSCRSTGLHDKLGKLPEYSCLEEDLFRKHGEDSFPDGLPKRAGFYYIAYHKVYIRFTDEIAAIGDYLVVGNKVQK